MSKLNYFGYRINVIQQTNGSYSYFLSNKFLKSKYQIDGFPTIDDAFKDACSLIDAIIVISKS
jgi:hypothetical protein